MILFINVKSRRQSRELKESLNIEKRRERKGVIPEEVDDLHQQYNEDRYFQRYAGCNLVFLLGVADPSPWSHGSVRLRRY